MAKNNTRQSIKGKLFFAFMLGGVVGAILLHVIGTYPPCW